MQFKQMEEELKEIIGEKWLESTMRFIREDAADTHNLLDVYYKIMPNRSVYFFKRFLVDNKVTLKRIPLEAKCLENVELSS